MTLIPTQVTFHGLKHSDKLEAEVMDRVQWLEQFYDRIVRCRVLLEVPHRHRHGGNHFHVRIELTVPRGTLVINHEPTLHAAVKDIEEATHRKESEIVAVHRYARVAIRDAFDVARRRVDDYAREQRGAGKQTVMT
jgi:ribosome-associated translation inhibitor RaiA